MTALLAIRKARPLDEWPPLRLVPERQLRQVARVEPCACGERVYQLAGDSVLVAVQEHNASPTHQSYRSQTAGDASTAAIGLVDVSLSRGGASGRSLPEVVR